MDGTVKQGKGRQWLAGIAFPYMVPTPSWGWGRLLQWLLHFVLAAAILLGLWKLNDALNMERALNSPWPALHEYWLPLLFLSVYLLTWLGACMWRCFFDRELPSVQFPDIEDAWAQALRALKENQIAIDELPLFLILGRPQTGPDSLFQAAGIPLIVPRTPHRPDAPLHLYASREAIFVTCAESSLLGQQVKLLAEQTVKNQRVRDQLTARLKYLCGLLSKKRRPYCPINGLVLLLPLEATTDAAQAGRITTLIQLDIQAMHQVLQIDCPYFALVCDLEKAPGFREFIEHIPEARRGHALGQSFPLMPDVDAHEIEGVMEKGVAALGRQTLAKAIYQNFSLEQTTEASGRLPAPVRNNIHLFQLLTQLRQSCQYLGQILYRGTQIELGTPAMVAGCYFVATGADAREQAFVADLFQEFLQNQNFVAWSPQAIRAETAYRGLTRLGYLGLLAFLMILGVLGYVV